MTKRTWMILGATSIIAEEFARLAAVAGYSLILVGRNQAQLKLIAADLRLRYRVDCEWLVSDFSKDLQAILSFFQSNSTEIDLFIAFSLMLDNAVLTFENSEELLKINGISTLQIIQAYLHKRQTQHRLIYLSSVAACRGRAKNSLYGGSKALIEVYLEGLQQRLDKNSQITIARLGFIDTQQTFGLAGIFYASAPKACAKACWRASFSGKQLIYHPFFWRYLMKIISCLPFFIYKRMKI